MPALERRDAGAVHLGPRPGCCAGHEDRIPEPATLALLGLGGLGLWRRRCR